MTTLALKILDSIAGQPWKLREDHRRDELSKPTSDLVQVQVFPHIFSREDEDFEEDEFYRYFHFGNTLDSKLWNVNETFQKFKEKAPFKFVKKLKKIEKKIEEIEKEISDIDPVLLGEKKFTKAWLSYISSKFQKNLESKSWGVNENFQGFTDEAPLRFVNKLKEIEKKIRDIDPSLLGEKRSTKAWLLLRTIDYICAIFKRIFTYKEEINALFCCRIALKCRLSDFKATFPFSCAIVIKDPAKIQKMITAIFPEKAKADKISFILKNTLPQDFKSFSYDKTTGNFTIKYESSHEYTRDKHNPLDLTAIKMGKVLFNIVCAETVKGNIETSLEPTISFSQGFSVKEVTFLNKKWFSRKLCNSLETSSRSTSLPALKSIRIKETGEIKATGDIDFQDWLLNKTTPTSKCFPYAKVESFLPQIKWLCPELKA